jgi:hypothetical protein
MNRVHVVLACGLLLPASAQAQDAALVTKVGTDTIAVETFTLTPARLEGELVTRGMGPRWKYSGDVVRGTIPVLHTAAYNAAATDTMPLQTANLTFVGDSVFAEVTAGGTTTTQRLASRHGALPLINLAFSFVQVATMQMSALRQDSADIPFFVVSGGQSLHSRLRRLAPDSFALALGGVDLLLKTDAHGRILRGAVPAQNVTIERSIGGPIRLEVAKPDYSAPADARYTAEPVVIPTPHGHTLAGTLTLPKQRSDRVPVVVTISGSGLQDRDEALLHVRGYRPFRQIAEALAEAGIGVLRYDDRGFGESKGNGANATLLDFASDTRAVLDYLRTRSDVASDKLFLLGHSEGGMVAPLVASTDSALRGIVLLAGTSRTGRRVLDYQNRYAVDRQTTLSAAARDSLYHKAVAALDSIPASQSWIRYFLDYDPLPTVRRVKVPVLILQGATDRQVTPDQAEELAAALRAAGNRGVDVHVLPDVNHLFLLDPSGDPAGYSGLKDTQVVTNAVDLVRNWVVKHAKTSEDK